jgi:hypothetical protein
MSLEDMKKANKAKKLKLAMLKLKKANRKAEKMIEEAKKRKKATPYKMKKVSYAEARKRLLNNPYWKKTIKQKIQYRARVPKGRKPKTMSRPFKKKKVPKVPQSVLDALDVSLDSLTGMKPKVAKPIAKPIAKKMPKKIKIKKGKQTIKSSTVADLGTKEKNRFINYMTRNRMVIFMKENNIKGVSKSKAQLMDMFLKTKMWKKLYMEYF